MPHGGRRSAADSSRNGQIFDPLEGQTEQASSRRGESFTQSEPSPSVVKGDSRHTALGRRKAGLGRFLGVVSQSLHPRLAPAKR